MRRKSKEECALIGSWTIEAPLRHHFKSHQVKLKYTPPINICSINLSKIYFNFGLLNQLKLYRTLSSKQSQKIHVDSKGNEWTRNSRPVGICAFRRIFFIWNSLSVVLKLFLAPEESGPESWYPNGGRFERRFYMPTVNFYFSAALDFVGINAYLYTDVTVWCHRLEV